MLGLFVNAGFQISAILQEKGPRTSDRTELFVNLDPSIRCDQCNSDDISRSTLRPKDRIVSWLNPLTPYRCWSCWHRFWRFKTPFEAATNLVLLTLVVLVVVRGFRRGRKRMNDAIENTAIPM